MLSPSIEQLIKIFAKFPTIGPKTAGRFVFYLLQSPTITSDELIKSIQDLKTKTKVCPQCFKTFEPFDTAQGEKNICEICSNTSRDKSLICIVEKEIDLEAVEKTKQFHGLYFILGGVLPALKKESAEQGLSARLNVLIERIQGKAAFAPQNGASTPKEIILALNPTPEGKNTALWLKRKLEQVGAKSSELGRGLPVGGEIEYADEETIAAAFEGRG